MNRFVFLFALLSLTSSCSNPVVPDIDVAPDDTTWILDAVITSLELLPSPDGRAIFVAAGLSPDTDLSRFDCDSRIDVTVRGPNGVFVRIPLVPDEWNSLICDELIVVAESIDDLSGIRPRGYLLYSSDPKM
jgi:hypothetical protein